MIGGKGEGCEIFLIPYFGGTNPFNPHSLNQCLHYLTLKYSTIFTIKQYFLEKPEEGDANKIKLIN